MANAAGWHGGSHPLQSQSNYIKVGGSKLKTTFDISKVLRCCRAQGEGGGGLRDSCIHLVFTVQTRTDKQSGDWAGGLRTVVYILPTLYIQTQGPRNIKISESLPNQIKNLPRSHRTALV